MPDPAVLSASSLEAAQRRLDVALDRLTQRLARGHRPVPSAPAAADEEAARLRADLEASQLRERQLEQLAAEASAALGRAADEVRAALSAKV